MGNTLPSHLPTELVPAKLIAEQWNISPSTLRRAAAEGKITAYRFGHRTVRYNPAEIMARMVTTNRDWEVA